MSPVFRVKVGKKYAIYLPRKVVEELQLREGENLVLSVEGEALVLRRPRSFFEASLKAPKKVKLQPEEVEELSFEAQRRC